MKIPFALATTATGLLLASCAAPTVNLATPQPIKVDIAVRLDVYQHAKEAAKKSTSSVAAGTDPAEARRNRMADIQTFKNSRLVGEGRDARRLRRSDPVHGLFDDVLLGSQVSVILMGAAEQDDLQAAVSAEVEHLDDLLDS